MEQIQEDNNPSECDEMQPDFKTLKYLILRFERGCPPMWWVSVVDDEIVGCYCDFPDDIENDIPLWNVLDELQSEYKRTCFSKGKNWKTLGFPSDEVMEAFNAKWKSVYEFVKERLKGRYEVMEPEYFTDRIAEVY